MKISKILKTTQGKKHKALVMDDDVTLRHLVLSMLEECGYAVHLTKTGQEAIDQYGKAKGTNKPFDIVVLDLNNPYGKEGEKTIRGLLAMDPEVRALALSGIHNPLLTDYKKNGFSGVLAKPFTLADLSRVLHVIRNDNNAESALCAVRIKRERNGEA